MTKGIHAMRYSLEARHRRSIRLKGYDYAQAGAYFVTVCSRSRECVFGESVEGEVRLNGAGRGVEEVWDALPKHYPGVEVDAFVVMPNHVHGIVVLPDRVGAQHAAPLRRGLKVAPGSLSAIVRSFKSAVTKRINEAHGMPDTRVWQRNYYERVIRDEDELRGVRQYIADNPAQWALDEENPAVG